MRRVNVLLWVIAATMTQGCAGANGDNGSPRAEQLEHVGTAAQIIAANAEADRRAQLLARKYSPDGEEVISFYQLAPGIMQMMTQGSNKLGTGFATKTFPGKTVAEIWSAIAPDTVMPETLAAYADSKSPEQSSVHQAAVQTATVRSGPSERAAVVHPNDIAGDASDYCSGGKMFDEFGYYYQQDTRKANHTLSGKGLPENWIGNYFRNFENDGGRWFTGTRINEIDFAVCDFAAGNDTYVGRGGQLTVTLSNSTNTDNVPDLEFYYDVPPSTHNAQTIFANETCTINANCVSQWKTQLCQPKAWFDANVTYTSNSGGDTFAYLAGAWTFWNGCW
jgi:hypothetical protein